IRKTSEETREANELVRKESEEIRKTSEETREANELVRKESEEVRKTSEEAREANELVRKESEEVRETQEIDRQNSIKRMEKELIDKTDEKFNEVDTTLDNKLKEQQKQIDDKIVETNNKINEVDTKIVEVDNKIVEVNTAKTDMTTTVSNKITEFENRFSELESLDARGELMQSREAIDGNVKDTLKDRLTYDFEKVNEKIAEMTSAATNVAFSKSYVESDWVADGEYFKLIVNHNLVTENIFVAILDEATKKSMTNSYTIVDSNTIEIFNESNINVRVTVVNGNTNKEVIQATINDNITTLGSTYSSVKIDAKIDESLIKINENKSNIATNLEKINLIQNKIGLSELSTVSKNISDAVNELDASVKILEAGGNLGQKLDSLKAKYDALSDKVLDILIYLELESGAVDEVGQWYDNLADSKNILSIDNLRLDTDRRRIFGSEGNVIFNKIDIPFSCYKVKYIHELDDNFIETISNTSTNAGANSIELEKFSYEVK
ncbi:phage tail protein, partial [Clostridioides difficile]|nr:phage tail protein [Clostridioides difficile]